MFQRFAYALLLATFAAAIPGGLQAETIPSGTKLIVRLDRYIERSDKYDQQFRASLAFPAFANGHEILPAGSRVEGEVRGSKKAIVLSPRRLVLPDGRKIDFNASVEQIENSRLKAQDKEGTIEQKGSAGEAVKQAGEIGIMGAEVGAMSTGSAQGMGIGAAVGVAAVIIGRKIAGRRHSTTIPAGTQLTLNLNKSIEVPDSIAEAKPVEMHVSDRADRRPTLRRQEASAPDPQQYVEAPAQL